MALEGTAANAHPVHVAQTFRRFHQCTIGEYLRRVRIEYACRELAHTETPLSDIAALNLNKVRERWGDRGGDGQMTLYGSARVFDAQFPPGERLPKFHASCVRWSTTDSPPRPLNQRYKKPHRTATPHTEPTSAVSGESVPRVALAKGGSRLDTARVVPEVRYARSGDVLIAYEVVGDGPFDLVWTPGALSQDRGGAELKGVPGEWRLYAVAGAA